MLEVEHLRLCNMSFNFLFTKPSLLMLDLSLHTIRTPNEFLNSTEMHSNQQIYRPALWMLFCIIITAKTVSAQYYDLSIGTERHFKPCIGLTGVCPASSFVSTNSIEKVIGNTTINNHNYAIVTWTQYSEGNIVELDTTFYRMDGSILIEHTGNDEQPIFDFNFSIGDSLEKRMWPYISTQDIQQYSVIQSSIASIIRIDTTIQFGDGVERRILWGDDSYITASGDTIYHIPQTLQFKNYQFLPWPDGTTNVPFYFVSDFGVMLTPFNHRGILMCGFRSATSVHFGCDALVSTSINRYQEIYHPHGIELVSNFPNPFNPTTILTFKTENTTSISFSIYNSIGTMVFNIPTKNYDPGTQHVPINLVNFSSGIYLVVIRSSNASYIHPITLIK